MSRRTTPVLHDTHTTRPASLQADIPLRIRLSTLIPERHCSILLSVILHRSYSNPGSSLRRSSSPDHIRCIPTPSNISRCNSAERHRVLHATRPSADSFASTCVTSGTSTFGTAMLHSPLPEVPSIWRNCAASTNLRSGETIRFIRYGPAPRTPDKLTRELSSKPNATSDRRWRDPTSR